MRQQVGLYAALLFSGVLVSCSFDAAPDITEAMEKAAEKLICMPTVKTELRFMNYMIRPLPVTVRPIPT